MALHACKWCSLAGMENCISLDWKEDSFRILCLLLNPNTTLSIIINHDTCEEISNST